MYGDVPRYRRKMYRTPSYEARCVKGFFCFILISKYHLLTSYVMPIYDRSSHTPIQVAVNIFVFAHSPIKLYGSRPILITGYYAQGVRQARLYSISITKRASIPKVYLLFFAFTQK